MKRALLTSILVGLISVNIGAQQWGAPAHATIVRTVSGFEMLNAQNLNFTFSIPLIMKPGRGVPYHAAITYNSNIYQHASTGFSVVQDLFGWLPVEVAGTMGMTTSSLSCVYYNPYNHQGTTEYYTQYSNFAWIDPAGEIHHFSVTTSTSNSCHTGTSTGSSTDAESLGFRLNISSYNNWIVYAPNGWTYLQSGQVEDTNGNYVTQSTDTMGTTPVSATNQSNCVNPVDGVTYPTCTIYNIIEPGSTATVAATVYSAAVSASTGCSSGNYSGVRDLPAYLVLPDYTSGSSWYYHFSYASTGQINSIRLPTGGVISISYGSLCTFNDGGPDSLTITENDNNGNSGTTTCTRAQGQTTIVRPDGSKQVVTFNSASQGALPLDIKYFDVDGTTLRREIVNTLDSSGKWPATSITYVDGVKTEEDDRTYNAADVDLLTSETVIDWIRDPSGATRKNVAISYDQCGSVSGQPPCPYQTENILDRVNETKVTDNSGTTVSDALLLYANGDPASSGITQNHDSAYSSTYTTRGNLWRVDRETDSSHALSTQFSYDDTGDAIDVSPTTGVFTVSYGDCYGAFVSSRTAPGGSLAASYDCSRGVPLSATDQNNVTTSFSYGTDGRIAAQSNPDGGGVTYSYPDPNDTEMVVKIDGAQSRVEWTTVDGFGRTINVQTQRPDGNFDTVQTIYDAMGRIIKLSRPFASGHPASGGASYTSFTYDGLGRLLSTTATDGSKTVYQYAQTAVKAVDPAGRSRILQTDGFGRLWKVCEVSSQSGSGTCGTEIAANGFLTTYSYDPMGRLTLVQQGSQSRSFSYDWAGRMLTSSDPESGLTRYTYDSITDATCPGGSSNAQGRLVLIQDAAGMKTCLVYDTWGRLASRSYSTGGTDTYTWDGSASSHSLGRIASAANANTAIAYTYDAMGRPITITEAPSGLGQQTISYQYNYLGSVTSESAGSRIFNFSYDDKGRLTQISDGNGGGVYLNGRSYNESDQVLAQTWSPGAAFSVSSSYTYNNRLQPWQMQYTALGTALTMQYQWGAAVDANGNVTSADDNGTLRGVTYPTGAGFPNNPNWSVTYTYDDLNRLSGALSTDGVINLTETLDSYGNRNSQNGTLSESFASNSSTNQITGFSYDAAGRLLSGTWGNVMTPRSFTWSAAGRIMTYSEGGTTVGTYKYDPYGRRIEVTDARNNSTWYLYGISPGSHPIAEYSAGMWYRHLIADGQYFGTVDSAGNIAYTTLDALGTAAGKVDSKTSTFALGRYDPYGEVIDPTGSEFTWTNQIRDQNGIDHFAGRSYSGNLARWLSPDPGSPTSANASDPQSWNRYAYVGNNPASLTDPDGYSYNPYIGGSPNYNTNAYWTNQLEGMNCMLDGMSAMCWIVEGVIHSGAGIDVTGRDTSPHRGLLLTDKGYVWAWKFFRAWSDGTADWQFGALLGYSPGDLQYIESMYQKAAALGPIDPKALNGSEGQAFHQLLGVLQKVDPKITDSDILVYEANGHDVEAKLSARALAALQSAVGQDGIVSHGILDTALHPGYDNGARQSGSGPSLHVLWISPPVADALGESTSLVSFHFDRVYPFGSPKDFLEHTECVLKVTSCAVSTSSGH